MMKNILKDNLDSSRNDVVLKTIQNILLNVFGERSFKRILRIMREKYMLEWQEIPEKSQTFSSALEDILGRGSVIIEDLILENLYMSCGKELVWKEELSFSDYVSLL